METIEEACEMALSMARVALNELDRNRPRAQWNWWNSGNCMNEGEMISWYSAKSEINKLINKIRKNPGYDNANELVKRAGFFYDRYRR